ncbi:MAG: SIR2 family protein, partial [Actinomycetota bacterium]|nr:SIR2 family protein [Actinomycetota bacterium]
MIGSSLTDSTYIRARMTLNTRRDVMGTQYLGVAGLEDEAEIADRTGKMLSRALNTGQAVCVAGSGLSTNYGFPIWRDFAEEAIATTKREHGRRISAHTKAYFDLLEKRLKKNERVTAEEIMTAFDVCAGFWPDLAFKRFVARRFQARASVGGPIARIIRELRIRRFLTTNYDDTIKQGLDACLGAGEAERYTIDSDGLLEFAVGTPRHRAGVFHLHGVVADEAEQLARLIVTESDYQELYLREDPAARAYREAVSLLFTGNPILFVGMGLTEFDLLHPLRESAAQPRRDVDQAPLFALMPQPDPRRRTLADIRGEAVGQRRQIYTRYGIHVLFYPPIEKFTKTFDVAAEFDAALGRLAEHGLEWWDEWQRKPPVQTPEFVRRGRKGACMLHNPAFERPDSFFALREDLAKIESTLRDRAAADEGCLAIAIGRAGMGKGGLGTRLVRRFDDVQYERRFFATLHFTNDFMSIIDAAARHLDEGAHDPSGASDDAPPSAMERLERALTKGRHLLVVGALERALEPFPPEPQLSAGADAADGSGRSVAAGRPSAEVAAFLNLAERAVRAGGKSHIVLTSAVTPVWREPGQEGPQAGEPLELQGVSEDEALRRFDGLIAARDTDRLRRVLGKHAYLMWLVMGALKRSGEPEERSAWAKRLFHRLSSVDRDRRRYEAVAAVIDVHIDVIASAGGRSRAEVRGDVVRVLETVSLFTTPVSSQTIADALAARNDIPKARTKKLLRELAAADLLLQVETRTRSAFTAHTAVRAFFLGRLGLSDIPGETHKFALAGYSAEVPVSQPGSREAHDKAARYV